METEKGVWYLKNRPHLLKTEGSQTPGVTTDYVPMEIESDAVPVNVAATPDNPETQPVLRSACDDYYPIWENNPWAREI